MNTLHNNSPAAIAAANDALIDRIVREVVQRLSTNNPPTPSASEPQRELRIESRLITTDSLRDLSHDVQRVIFCSRAVITPAAVDELKTRGVKWVRDGQVVKPVPTMSHSLRGAGNPTRGAVDATQASTGLTIARVDGANGPGWLCASKLGHATINGGLSSVLERLKQALQSGGCGVLVTSAPAVAVYYACRAGMRAVYAKNAVEVADAQRQFDANLIVIDANQNPNGALECFSQPRQER